MEFLNDLKWRYATKKFDATKKVSDEDIAKLKEAIQLAATSYGLQLFKVLDIQDEALREKLKPASWGQTQITDASHLFVFCGYTQVERADLDSYISLKADAQGLDVDTLKPYADYIEGALSKWDDDAIQNWTARQTYIALSNLMNAAAILKIDTCPMEGFDSAKYDEILGLKEKGLKAAVVATIGYRSEEDATQHGAKVRKPIEDLFELV